MEWMTIDSAPKDGRRFLAYWPHRPSISVCRYYADEYKKNPRPYWEYWTDRVGDARENKPSHWMPFPEPPKQNGE